MHIYCGLSDVHDLKQGMTEWLNRGMPIIFAAGLCGPSNRRLSFFFLLLLFFFNLRVP